MPAKGRKQNKNGGKGNKSTSSAKSVQEIVRQLEKQSKNNEQKLHAFFKMASAKQNPGNIVSGGSTYKSFRRAPPPPTGPNSFVFTYVFTKSACVGGWCPLQRGLASPKREILDPPLIVNPENSPRNTQNEETEQVSDSESIAERTVKVLPNT